jgi:hypothetical protein
VNNAATRGEAGRNHPTLITTWNSKNLSQGEEGKGKGKEEAFGYMDSVCTSFAPIFGPSVRSVLGRSEYSKIAVSYRIVS